MLTPKLFRPSISAALRSRCISSLNGNKGQKAEENEVGSTTSMRMPPCQMPNMLDIGSRSIFDEDQDIFRQRCVRWSTQFAFVQIACFAIAVSEDL